MVILSHLPPEALAQARYQVRRLRSRFTGLAIVVGRWGEPGSEAASAGLSGVGATHVAFNGLDAPFSVQSDTQIATTVPKASVLGSDQVTTGPILVNTPDHSDGRTMTREEILNVMRQAPNVGTTAHEEFADYTVVLEQRRKIDDEWTQAEFVYMAVDGKLAMANEDHRRQGKRLDFGEPKILLDNEEQLTLLVTVTSEGSGPPVVPEEARRVTGRVELR